MIRLLLTALVLMSAQSGLAESVTSTGLNSTWRTDESAVTTGTGIRMFGGLFICLGVLGAGVFVAKRFGIGGARLAGPVRLRVLERAALANRAAVCLVAVDGREFLIASSGDSVAIQSIQPQGANSDLLIKDLEELCESSAL